LYCFKEEARASFTQTFAPSGQKTARSASPPASRALRPQRLIADRQAPREHERFKPAHVLDHNRLAGHPALETYVFESVEQFDRDRRPGIAKVGRRSCNSHAAIEIARRENRS
jgi:hypothetical protein